MKITDVKIFETHGPHGNWLFVKLYTNTGLTGVGECSMERHHKKIVASLEAMKDFLIGEMNYLMRFQMVILESYMHAHLIIFLIIGIRFRFN